jgi:hypothetical protein
MLENTSLERNDRVAYLLDQVHPPSLDTHHWRSEIAVLGGPYYVRQFISNSHEILLVLYLFQNRRS